MNSCYYLARMDTSNQEGPCFILPADETFIYTSRTDHSYSFVVVSFTRRKTDRTCNNTVSESSHFFLQKAARKLHSLTHARTYVRRAIITEDFPMYVVSSMLERRPFEAGTRTTRTTQKKQCELRTASSTRPNLLYPILPSPFRHLLCSHGKPLRYSKHHPDTLQDGTRKEIFRKCSRLIKSQPITPSEGSTTQ